MRTTRFLYDLLSTGRIENPPLSQEHFRAIDLIERRTKVIVFEVLV